MIGELVFAIAVPLGQMIGLVILGLFFRTDRTKGGAKCN